MHARSVVATALDTHTGELVTRKLTPDFEEITDFITRQPGPAAAVYEAGPTGFGLARHLNDHGIRCVVAAPSKLNRPAGDRVKTDKNDAIHLARLLRMDEVTPVTIPAPLQEAARDLVRAREDTRGDLMSARHRLSKLLLRHGLVYTEGKAWTIKHDEWLRRVAVDRLPDTATRLAFDAAYDTVLATTARRDRLDKQITGLAKDSEFTGTVDRLSCLRGISTLTGFGLAVEIGDWQRFTGKTIGSYIGLVPTEYSSGSSRSQGGVTKTGNSHVRRLLIEAAWHHRRQYRVSKQLQARFDRAPAPVRERGDAGNRRLHDRWAGLIARKKNSNTANAAIARELAGWCWSLAVMDT